MSARLPYVSVYGILRADQSIERHLDLGELNAPDYAVQSLQQPTSVIDGRWQWSERVDQGCEQTLNFTAANTSETQHDSYDALLSGDVFGLAGGALIALVQELVAPFRLRRELRPPEPGS